MPPAQPLDSSPRQPSPFDLTVRTLVGVNLCVMALSFIPVDGHRGSLSIADKLFYRPDSAGFRLDFPWLAVSSLIVLILLVCAWIPPRASSLLNTGLCLLELLSLVGLAVYLLFTM